MPGPVSLPGALIVCTRFSGGVIGLGRQLSVVYESYDFAQSGDIKKNSLHKARAGDQWKRLDYPDNFRYSSNSLSFKYIMARLKSSTA